MSVEVRYLGHLGNNLFEYALGRILAEELGLSLHCLPATDQPGWSDVERASGIVDRLDACHSHFVDVPQRVPGREVKSPQLRYVLGEKPLWGGHGINMDYLLRHGAKHRIVLHGYFQRTGYYHPFRDRIRQWYRFREAPPVALHAQDIIVHLRQSLDMFMLDRAIDLDFYRGWLGGMHFRKMYVCGLGLDSRVKQALAPFKPVYLDFPAIDTLKLMATANRIVMANSTFSWWGAYLSEASEIHYPRVTRNFWSQDSNVDLEVPEQRYRYIDDVPVHTWRPFRLRGGVRMADPVGGTGEAVFAFETSNGRQRLVMPPELAGFGQWLAGMETEPFGMHEVHALDLSANGLHLALRLLFEMHGQGVLHAEAGAMRMLARLHGTN